MGEGEKRHTGVYGCVVMASGKATRFGSDKLVAPFMGKPLVMHTLAALKDVFDVCVVVTRSEEVARLCHEAQADCILHELPHRDDTVRLGMERMGECTHVAFYQADQPLMTRVTLERLLDAAEGDPESIWRVGFEGRPGAPMTFPRWSFDELCALPPSKGGGFVAKKHPERVKLVPVQDEVELMDVDTKEDLATLEALAARRLSR